MNGESGLRAAIIWGGWEGHQPREVASVFAEALEREHFTVTLHDTLESLADPATLRGTRLIVPVWTMGSITDQQLRPLLEAVAGGAGLAGCHGGMCDAFRDATDYQFMTGGQWVAHPGNDGVTHRIRISDRDHYITRGTDDFSVATEQYYMHVDPANRVLATTRFPVADGPHVPNGAVDMPVVWTKHYGRGRVFYCSLGHQAAIVRLPQVLRLCTRGMLWAAGEDVSRPDAGIA